MTSVMLLTESAGPGNDHRHYHKCGWSNLEAMLSRLPKTRRADLWEPVVDVGHPKRSHLLPPMSLDDFKELVADCHFLDRRDEPLVVHIYERSLHRALGGADALRCDRAGWGDQELETLRFSLPLCANLRSLGLAHNTFQATGFIAFSQALGRGALPNLRILNLNGNDQVNDWRGALLAFAAASLISSYDQRPSRGRHCTIYLSVAFSLVSFWFENAPGTQGEVVKENDEPFQM